MACDPQAPSCHRCVLPALGDSTLSSALMLRPLERPRREPAGSGLQVSQNPGGRWGGPSCHQRGWATLGADGLGLADGSRDSDSELGGWCRCVGCSYDPRSFGAPPRFPSAHAWGWTERLRPRERNKAEATGVTPRPGHKRHRGFPPVLSHPAATSSASLASPWRAPRGKELRPPVDGHARANAVETLGRNRPAKLHPRSRDIYCF